MALDVLVELLPMIPMTMSMSIVNLYYHEGH